MSKPIHICITIPQFKVVWFPRTEEKVLSDLNWEGKVSVLSFVQENETLLQAVRRLSDRIIPICGRKEYITCVVRAAISTALCR